jgi:outer membrane lipopolysaccharide assembly protein LptE/RlpB
MKKIKIIILFAGILLLTGCGNKTKPVSTDTDQVKIPKQTSNTTKPAEEQFAKNAVQNIQAKINKVDISAIEVTTESGEKLTLKIPQQGANFYKVTKQKNNEMKSEEIGLFDIPKEQMVSIQYDGQNNQVMMISVK